MTFVYIFVPVGVYLIGALYTFGRVASSVAWTASQRYSYRSRPDWGDGVFLGLMNAVVWPISLPIWMAVWYTRSARVGVFGGWLFKPPPHLREVAHDQTTRERDAYIKRLEERAGVR